MSAQMNEIRSESDKDGDKPNNSHIPHKIRANQRKMTLIGIIY